MTYFHYSNNATSKLSAGISTGDTSLTLESGDGALFPDSFPYRVTIWDSDSYSSPGDDSNSEIVEVTGKSTDILTISRAKESTSDNNHLTGHKVALLITAGTFEDPTYGINPRIDSHISATDAHHTKYTDAEAIAATDGQIDADTVDGAHLVDIQNEIDGDISTHAGDADAHHTRYTDAEAISAVAAADDYVKNTGDTVTGDILIDSNTGTYGLIVSRDGKINVERIKTTVDDTSVDHEYINDEETGNIIWTIENLDTAASDGSLYNYSQLRFFSDNIDTYLSLNGNKFFHEGFMGSGSGLDADTLDGSQLSDIQSEIDNDISTHASDVDAHHAKYTDSEAVAAINNDGDHGSTAQHNYFSGDYNDLSNKPPRIFAQSTEPSSPQPGDVWIKL